MFDIRNPLLLLVLIATVAVTGVMAGSYPAFFLSSFQPGIVLKGNATSGFHFGLAPRATDSISDVGGR